MVLLQPKLHPCILHISVLFHGKLMSVLPYDPRSDATSGFGVKDLFRKIIIVENMMFNSLDEIKTSFFLK